LVIQGSPNVVSASKPSAYQRRAMNATREILAGVTDVRAFAAGRVEGARMTTGAWWVVGIFGSVFAFFFLFLHVILLPGALVLILLYESVKPKRGVVVTSLGVSELRLKGLNGRPAALMATTDHGVLSSGRARVMGKRIGLTFGSETILVRERDYATLLAGLPAAPVVSARSAAADQSPPPIPPPPPSIPS
jgi:hypothetical protein